MRNANKSDKNPVFCNGEESGKMILNPNPGPDYLENLTYSSHW